MSAISLTLPFLGVEDIVHVSEVCKQWNKASEDDHVWAKFVEGDKLVPSQTHRDAVKQMREQHKLFDKYQKEYEERLRSWCPAPPPACGMRPPPQPPRWGIRDMAVAGAKEKVDNGAIGGFTVHPNSTANPTVSFGADLMVTSQELLKLLVLTSQVKLPASKEAAFKNPDFVGRSCLKYINFMKLKHQHKNLYLVPTLEVEYVWVCHLIRPTAYHADCKKLFGEIIPHEILLTREYECLNKQNALKETAKLYEATFGHPYLSESGTGKDSEFIIYRKQLQTYEKPSPPKFLSSVPSYHTGVGQLPNSVKVNPEAHLSMSVSDVMLDFNWLKFFCDYMKDVLDDPTNVIPLRKNSCNLNDQAVFTNMIKGYERFLYLSCKYPAKTGHYVHPTYAIDLMWHSHMIHPLIYARDCDRLVGYLVDHEPWPKSEKSEMEKNVKDTTDIWQQEFCCPIDMDHKYAINFSYY